MADQEPRDLVLEYLRRIVAKQEQHDRKFDEISSRLSLVEQHIVGIKRELVLVHEAIAGVHVRLDHHEKRLDRIERRLELREEPTS